MRGSRYRRHTLKGMPLDPLKVKVLDQFRTGFEELNKFINKAEIALTYVVLRYPPLQLWHRPCFFSSRLVSPILFSPLRFSSLHFILFSPLLSSPLLSSPLLLFSLPFLLFPLLFSLLFFSSLLSRFSPSLSLSISLSLCVRLSCCSHCVYVCEVYTTHGAHARRPAANTPQQPLIHGTPFGRGAKP